MTKKTIISVFILLTILSFLITPGKASPGLQEDFPPTQTTGVDPAAGRTASQDSTDAAISFRPEVGPLALGELLFEVPVETAMGDNHILGVEFDGTYFWFTGGNSGTDPNKLYKIDTSGALLATYDQPAPCSGWGGRDLAYDGTYLYFGCDDNLIHKIDPATGAQVGTISFPTQVARALAYVPATRHFWTANYDSSIYEIDNTGAIIHTFPPVGLSTYGMAYDSMSGFLWLWSQDGPDPMLTASQLDPVTGTLTGVSFLGSGVAGEMAGGAAISYVLVPGKAVFLGLNQGSPDRLGVYELFVQTGVFLAPSGQEGSGCNGTPHTYQLTAYNNTGTNQNFNLEYSSTAGLGTLTGPATVYVMNEAAVIFEVTLTPDLRALEGDEITGVVEITGNSSSDSALITHTIDMTPTWNTIPASAPSWAGAGYPIDACTAFNAAGEEVTYLIGDTSGTGPVGFWGYNHHTNTWFQPAPANLPADRWSPDWAYDEETNLCYMTGGANTPGPGTFNEAYMFNPVANSFLAMPSFTTARDFHNSWVGTIDGTKALCIGGGNNGVGLASTQCFLFGLDLWAAENVSIGAMPINNWAGADGVLHDAGGDIFLFTAGDQAGLTTDAAWYWDDADNSWHSAGNTGANRFRMEGEFLNGEFYQVGGSLGGFDPTSTAVRGTFDGTSWTWTALPDTVNPRMDNLVTVANGTIWIVDGYGPNTAAYVEKLIFCPVCNILSLPIIIKH